MSSSSQVSKIILFPDQYLAVPTFSNEVRLEGRIKLQIIYTFIVHIYSLILTIKGLPYVRLILSAEVVHLDEQLEAYLLEIYFNEQVRRRICNWHSLIHMKTDAITILKNKTKNKPLFFKAG